MFNTIKRFQILCFETVEERAERKRREQEELEASIRAARLSIEEKGVCENCFRKGNLRWAGKWEEFYSCYECFVYGIQCEAEAMAPMYTVEMMDEYMEEWEWDELCEEKA